MYTILAASPLGQLNAEVLFGKDKCTLTQNKYKPILNIRSFAVKESDFSPAVSEIFCVKYIQIQSN